MLKKCCNTQGQATVEAVVVASVFLCLALAFGALWKRASEGILARYAQQGASHVLDKGIITNTQDIFVF